MFVLAIFYYRVHVITIKNLSRISVENHKMILKCT